MTYQNYHKHSYYTNIVIADSTVSYEDYAKRAVELGHKTICSLEHGWQGRYFETYEVAKKYNLKFIFGTEAYWVLDRTQRDMANCHICLLARNEIGRQEINKILSEANITGFYRVPRIDLKLIMSLNPENVVITTACIGFFKYGIDKSIEVIKLLADRFKENFYLEVQYHDFDRQKEINNTLLELKMQIIFGADSHYIYPVQNKERNNYLYAKGMHYAEEKDFIIDYPSVETVIERFEKQGVLNSNQIEEAINNTNILLDFDNIEFNKDIKLPTIYNELNQDQKNEVLKDLVYANWENLKQTIPPKLHDKYEREIKKELDIIINTNMADYFLLDNIIVLNSVIDGGIVTKTGRGSGVSFYTNNLLGFTEVDRIAAKVQMFPERFMSETRIFKTKSLPDLDLNLGNPEVFMAAQKKLLGEHSAYQMIAFGTTKQNSAFKLYAKSQNLDFTIANNITDQLKQFDTDYKYADEETKETLNVYDYVDPQYWKYIDESKKYTKIIADKKPHPCASLIYQGDIREEWGILKIKDMLCTVIDGQIAENYKFLKNDLLKVDVVNVIDRVYKRIGIKQHSVNELIEITKNDKKTWNIYSNGLTVCINQCEKDSTRQKIMKYKPRNISELTAFVAAIRPSFQSMYSIFEARENFSYGIPEFDSLIQTDEIKDSFILYQEQIMATLNYAGIDNSETYGIIKAIAKKKEKEVLKWREIFLEGFSKRSNKGSALKVWQIIEDSCQYGFNASHAYCVACDSLYEAYLKANYPLEFFTEILNYYAEKNEKDKLAEIKNELSHFKITINPICFRYDNRTFILNKANKSINESMVSIKELNKQISKELYKLRDENFNSIVDLLEALKTHTSIQSNQLDILIRLDYFREFGTVPDIQEYLKLFNLFWQNSSKSFRKQFKKDQIKSLDLNLLIIERNSQIRPKSYIKLNCKNILKELISLLPEQDPLEEIDIIKTELDLLGYIRYKTNNKLDRHRVFILEIIKGRNEKINPKIRIYSLGTGKTAQLKIQRKLLNFIKII